MDSLSDQTKSFAPTPTVALILNWRDAARTEQCAKSLLADGVEKILIWDNSEDGSLSAKQLKNRFVSNPGVSIIESSRNLGFAAGVNRGIEALRGQFNDPWILLINNDAIVAPGTTTKLKKAATENCNATIVYPMINHGGDVLGTVYYHRLTGLLSRRRIPGSFPYASGCCLLVATSRLQEKLFDEDFFMYGEDWELGWRLSSTPGAAVLLPEVLVSHEGSASSRIGSPFYEFSLVNAHLALANKISRGWIDYLSMMLARGLVLSSRAFMRSIRHGNLEPVRALAKSWRQWVRSAPHQEADQKNI